MSGFWDYAAVFGMTPEIAQAVLNAEADPTSENVKAVFEAYAAAGMTPSPKLVAHLIEINEERHPEDTVRSAAMPYLIFGAALIFWFLRR